MGDPDAASGETVLREIEAEVCACRACPRLVAWREETARSPRASFAGQVYWARPVPGFGDPSASVAVVGLAPAAHGANRTGRMFTGDRSGDWLFAAMHRAGLANQPVSVSADDGLRLCRAWVTASVRCAPPANRPSTTERDRCGDFLRRELAALTGVSVMVALGGFAYDALSRVVDMGRRPRFGHGVEVPLPDGRWVVCCYHPSQQNTFTGRLTEAMLDAVFERAVELSEASTRPEGASPR